MIEISVGNKNLSYYVVYEQRFQGRWAFTIRGVLTLHKNGKYNTANQQKYFNHFLEEAEAISGEQELEEKFKKMLPEIESSIKFWDIKFFKKYRKLKNGEELSKSLAPWSNNSLPQYKI